jgi:hypothetical protein
VLWSNLEPSIQWCNELILRSELHFRRFNQSAVRESVTSTRRDNSFATDTVF